MHDVTRADIMTGYFISMQESQKRILFEIEHLRTNNSEVEPQPSVIQISILKTIVRLFPSQKLMNE